MLGACFWWAIYALSLGLVAGLGYGCCGGLVLDQAKRKRCAWLVAMRYYASFM